MPSLHLPKLPRRNPDRPTLKQRAAALKASAARVLRRKPAPPTDPFEGIPCPEGFVPYPFGAPEGFFHIPGALQAEGRRLLLLALREMERLAPDPETCPDEDERRRWGTAIHRDLRIDALMALAGRLDPPKAPLPEPGSEAAMAALDAASREHTFLSAEAVTGYPELKRDAVSWWTVSCLCRAMETGDITPAECARLYPLAQERELRIHAAALATNTGALHALAFAEDYPHPKEEPPAEDVDLLKLEAEIAEAHRAFDAAFDRWAAVRERVDRVPIPDDLQHQSIDNHIIGMPETKARCVGPGHYVGASYGEAEVAVLRDFTATICSTTVRPWGLSPGGSGTQPDPASQERVASIVAAWDRYEEARSAIPGFADLVTLEAEKKAAGDARVALFDRLRRMPAATIAGAAVKARVLSAWLGDEDPAKVGLEDYEANDDAALSFSIAGDVLRLAAGPVALAEGGEMPAPHLDADLVALEAAHSAAEAAFSAACERLGKAEDAYSEPEMPVALRVWRNDWVNQYLPRTPTYAVEGKEGRFHRPYGGTEVEQLRGVRCMRQTYGDDGEPSPNGGRWMPDPNFQQRVDAIVSENRRGKRTRLRG